MLFIVDALKKIKRRWRERFCRAIETSSCTERAEPLRTVHLHDQSISFCLSVCLSVDAINNSVVSYSQAVSPVSHSPSARSRPEDELVDSAWTWIGSVLIQRRLSHLHSLDSTRSRLMSVMSQRPQPRHAPRSAVTLAAVVRGSQYRYAETRHGLTSPASHTSSVDRRPPLSSSASSSKQAKGHGTVETQSVAGCCRSLWPPAAPTPLGIRVKVLRRHSFDRFLTTSGVDKNRPEAQPLSQFDIFAKD